MKTASVLLVGALALCGSTLAQASVPQATQAPVAKSGTAGIVLAKNGADNARGDDHGGRRNGGHDDGANHH